MTKKIRVVTYNLHKGLDTLGKRNIMNPLKTALQGLDADFVFLQEVMGASDLKKHRIDGWKNSAQFEYLADSIWDHHAYAQNSVYTSRHHGNAILSKYPIVSFENIDISNHNLEKRGLLHAVAHDPDTDTYFDLLCVHIDLVESGRLLQIKKIADRILSHVEPGRPLLMCGDFNDWKQRTAKQLDKYMHLGEAFRHTEGRFARTFPSFLPVLPLDRIYYRNLKVLKAAALKKSPWNRLSDHIALMADFEIKS